MRTIFRLYGFFVSVFLLLALFSCDNGSSSAPQGDNCDCPAGWYCQPDGSCAEPCVWNNDCPSGKICVDEHCVDETTVTDGDLDKDPDTTVPDGDSNDGSNDGSDDVLPDGDTSNDDPGDNTQDTPLPDCVEDKDCPEGYHCSDEICVPDVVDGDSEEPAIEQEQDDYICYSDVPQDNNNPTVFCEYNAQHPIDFGAVPVLGSADKRFEIGNIGAQSLTIIDVYLETMSQEFAISAALLPATISGSELLEVSVTYTALDRNEDINALIIYTNDPTTPCLRVPMTTSIKATAEVLANPDRIDFGIVRKGTGKTEGIVLENVGVVPLGIINIALTAASSEAFGINGAPTSYPLALEAGETIGFDVSFSPEDTLEHTGWIEVTSNDSNTPTMLIPLTGTGGEPEIEVFPLTVDFSGVQVGDSLEREVTVRNVGTYELNVSEISKDSNTTTDYSIAPTLPLNIIIAPEEETVLTVTYAPDGQGTDEGGLHIFSDDADEPEVIVVFSGEAVPPDIDVTPLTIDFGRVPLQTTVSRTVEIRNIGNGQLSVTDVSLQTDTVFAISQWPGASTLASLESITVDLAFTPTALGLAGDTMIVASNDPDEPEIWVLLNGEGIAPPEITVSPMELDFGSVAQGQRTTEAFTITNTGAQTLNITGWRFTVNAGVFGSQTSPWPTQLNPGESSTITMWFRPPALGIHEDWLLIQSNDPVNPEVQVHHIGEGVLPQNITVVPNPLIFPDTIVGQSNDADLTVFNSGRVPLTIRSYVVQNGTHFSVGMSNPPMVVGAENSATVTMTFTPQQGGALSDSLVIISDDPDTSMYTVGLQGNGIAPQDIEVDPNPVSFGQVPMDEHRDMTVTIRNLGSLSLSISNIYLQNTSYFSMQSQPNTTIGPGASTSFTLRFSPNGSAASRSTNLIIESNDPDEGTLTVPVQGSGIDTNAPPVAIALCNSGCSNGSGHEWQADPITTVSLTGVDSYDTDGNIVAYQWTLVSKPSGSYTSLSSSNTVTTSANVDLPGEYVFRLMVTDNDNLVSADTYESRAVVTVYPHEKMHIQLSWEYNQMADVDLHLWGPGASPPSSGSHCYYSDNSPNWGAAGNPSLDHDNVGCSDSDNTPENINLDNPCDGCEYTVMVQGYASHDGSCSDQEPQYTGTTPATLRIYLSNSSTPDYECTYTISNWSSSWSSRAYLIPVKVRWHGSATSGYGEIIELCACGSCTQAN